MSHPDFQPDITSPIAEGRIARLFAVGNERVIKLARDWVPGEWLEDEFRTARLVQSTGLQVAKAHEIIELDGSTGIIFDRLIGPTMLERIGRAPHKAAGFGKTMGRLHADMHRKAGPEGLPDNHERLHRKISSVPEEVPAALRAKAMAIMQRLPAAPAQLLHGDFHPGNIIMTDDGPVIIDWPDAARGHPLADVARTVVLASLGGVPKHPVLRALVISLRAVFKQAYLQTYFRHSPYKRQDLNQWMYPVIFARLSENIEVERKASIRWLEKLHPKV